MAEREKEKPPTDLLARARKMAQEELDALRAKPEKKRRPTLLTGFRPASFEIVTPSTTLSVSG